MLIYKQKQVDQKYDQQHNWGNFTVQISATVKDFIEQKNYLVNELQNGLQETSAINHKEGFSVAFHSSTAIELNNTQTPMNIKCIIYQLSVT